MGSIFASEYVWIFVAFVTLFALVWKPAGSALAGMLDERAARIRKDLDDAAKLRREAQALLDEYRRKHADALATADQIVAHARSEAERLARVAADELEASLKRREAAAMQRIARAEAQAAAEIRNAAVDLAVAATRRLVEQKLTPANADAVVDGAIRDLPARLT